MERSQDEHNRREFLRQAGGTVAVSSLSMGPTILRGHPASLQANSKITCGIIGIGSQGSTLIRSMEGVADVEVIALCDNYPPHLEAAKKLVQDTRGNTPDGYDDYRKLLERNDLDAVMIAAPNPWHKPMAEAALDRDLHILVEKPMCHTIDACNALYRLVKKRDPDTVFQIGQHRRTLPHYLQAIRQIRDGEIGEIRKMKGAWYMNASARRRLPDDSNYSPEFLEQHLNWRLYRKNGGDPAVDQGTHQIDVANWLMHGPPVSVVGYGHIDHNDGRDVFDNCSLTFKYANGQHYEYSLCYSNGHLGSQEMILGTKGTMLLEQRGAVSWMEPVRGARPAARTTSGQTREIITGASRRAARRSPTYTMGEPIGEFLVDWYEPEMHDFFRNIRDNKKPLCDVEVARNAAVSMYMGVRAMVTGEPVYWDQTWNTV